MITTMTFDYPSDQVVEFGWEGQGTSIIGTNRDQQNDENILLSSVNDVYTYHLCLFLVDITIKFVCY